MIFDTFKEESYKMKSYKGAKQINKELDHEIDRMLTPLQEIETAVNIMRQIIRMISNETLA